MLACLHDANHHHPLHLTLFVCLFHEYFEYECYFWWVSVSISASFSSHSSKTVTARNFNTNLSARVRSHKQKTRINWSGVFDSKQHLHKFKINIIFLFGIYEFFWSKPPKNYIENTHRSRNTHSPNVLTKQREKSSHSIRSVVLLIRPLSWHLHLPTTQK